MLRVHRVIASSRPQCCVSNLAASIVQTAARRRVTGRLTDRRDAAEDAAHEQDTTDDAGERGDSGVAATLLVVNETSTREGANDQDDDASDQERGRFGFIVPSCAWPCIQACIRVLIEVACFH